MTQSVKGHHHLRWIIIDREAREIMCLVASVCPPMLSWLNRLTDGGSTMLESN